jgi:hypothetical protein
MKKTNFFKGKTLLLLKHDYFMADALTHLPSTYYLYLFEESGSFSLYDPLPRVLSASGVIMRFKKRLSMER